MKKVNAYNIGDIAGDLECIDIKKEPHVGTKYLMKCAVCGREKWMLGSTIAYQKGITHKACGQGLKTKYPTFYDRWQAMRTRTTNEKYQHYADYGGRGINSDEFQYFIDFYDAMFDSYMELANVIGEKNTSLERKDVNKGYTKENCIWIDKHQQQGNCRKTLHFIVTFPDGHTEIHKNALAFAKEHNLHGPSVVDVLNGRTSHHHNYKFTKIDGNTLSTTIEDQK